MKEFELCFEIDCKPIQYLIPSILPKDEPQDTELQGNTLEFQYHYRVLPNSIISRFIVNTSDYIHNQTYWRSGVMLAYQENKEICNIARIRSDSEDKKIFIAISGREKTRRSFLSIIRSTFQKIHSNSSNLDITEWVPVPNYPDHDPLKYTELLGLEEMGENHKVIGELKLRLDLRQLLDGYEDIKIRQRKQSGLDVDVSEDSPYNISVNVVDNRHSKTVNQHGKRDNFGGDYVEHNKIG
jgi:internalin A